MREQSAWGIWCPWSKRILIFTLHDLRRLAIRKMLEEWSSEPSWKRLYQMGYRCVRVKIRTLKQ